MAMNVLVVGTGAIGAFYGALLAAAGATVTVLCRSDYGHVKQHGITIDSTLGRWLFRPAQVLQSTDAWQGQADVLLLCTKVIPELNRAALIRPYVHAQTAIVFIQNGVDIEPEMYAAFPDNEVVSGLAFICCSRVAAGEVRHFAYGRLVLGNMPGFVSAKTQQLAALFAQTGIVCETTANIVAARWQKCIWNAAFSSLSVLSGGLPTLVILQNQEALVRNVMYEVVDIAAASGHLLPATVVDDNIAMTYNMPPYKTSMLLDVERGHTPETEAIVGNVVRVAQRLGVACPHLQTLYALLKLRDVPLPHAIV